MKYFILENIRSAHNVGAIFRTADGSGVHKLLLVGYTPTPIDRFGRPQPEVLKTSLGACDTVAWEYYETTQEAVAAARKEGCEIVSVELHDSSIPLRGYTVSERVAYVLGNEVDGVDEKTVANSDVVVHLPMLGEKESLNVATTAGIVMYYDLLHT